MKKVNVYKGLSFKLRLCKNCDSEIHEEYTYCDICIKIVQEKDKQDALYRKQKKYWKRYILGKGKATEQSIEEFNQ